MSYYQASVLDIGDIFTLLNELKTVNPVSYRQTYINVVYTLLYAVSLYVPYIPQGTYTLIELDNITVQIVNGTIQAIYNNQQVVGLLNIAQLLSSVVNYTVSGLYGIISAVYYSLKQITQQVLPSSQEISEVNSLLSDLQKYVS